jgi:hypothetical protein
MVIYKICVFGADRKSNMAARDHLKTIHAMFALNWLTGFREEDF